MHGITSSIQNYIPSEVEESLEPMIEKDYQPIGNSRSEPGDEIIEHQKGNVDINFKKCK